MIQLRKYIWEAMYDNKAINRHIRGLVESPTLATNDRCIKLEAEGKKIYNLSLGQSPFPIPAQVVEALRLHAKEKKYLSVQGLESLREVVAEFHKRKDGIETNAENVMIGPGSKELLFLLQLTFKGEIIIPTPSWVSYAPQAKIIGHKIRFIKTAFNNRWHIGPEHINRLIERDKNKNKPRILILNSPGNPDGLAYSEEELKAIADTAREHRILVLSDEIYGQIHHEGKHVSISRFYPEGTILSSGLSKWCGAGGWRLGTFTFPTNLCWLMGAMIAVASETYTSVSAPIQYAAVEAFKINDATERYLWNVRRILNRLGAECASILQSGNINVHSPEAAFYIFADFSSYAKKLKRRGITNSVELTEKLLTDTGVAALPGSVFNRPPKELTARLAYVNFDGVQAMTASEKIPLRKELPKRFTNNYCKDTLSAMRRISRWVNKK